MSIQVLEPHVAAKIAAGEVVERPSSVVKELVENSLDASASQITVEMQGGGKELIRVTDNGCGIPADQVETAFQRHATSKLSDVEELESINTLGFRGEALPSIVSVARVSLVTRPHNSPVGHEVHLVAGQVTKSRACGCPPGTSVVVEGLFENLPARRQFLKSASAERGRVSELVSRYALAFPDRAFRLVVDGRNTLSTTGNGNLTEALASVYGTETARSMLEVSWEDAGKEYAVAGLISAPSLNRSNRSYTTFLVNHRWVQSPMLSYALGQSYHSFLPEKRHPVAVLNITIPPEQVDVNVHPAKREVRFRQEDRVFSALQRAVRATLIATSPVPEIRLPEGGYAEPPGHAPRNSNIPAVFASGEPQSSASFLDLLSSPQPASTPVEAMSSLRVLGQVQSTYLVAEGPDGVYLIDQHAAHERVLFEKVTDQVSKAGSQVQSLLEPVAVELSPAQEESVHSNAQLLERYGFLLEPFGEKTYLLRGIPSIYKGEGPGRALVEVLDLMAFEEIHKTPEEALAASIACHSAVRAGMVLSRQEMEELVQQLRSCHTPHTCPHGRPTMIHLSSHHLERQFGRT